MANNYEITMKQYNGNDYDTLYPKNVSQQVLLNSSDIANQLGLIIANPTIADAISKLQLNIYEDSVVMGSYVGTGETGSEHPNQITFDFVPRLIIVLRNADGSFGIFLHGVPHCYRNIAANVSLILIVTWLQNGKTVSWFGDGDQGYTPPGISQFNIAGEAYTYLAI